MVELNEEYPTNTGICPLHHQPSCRLTPSSAHAMIVVKGSVGNAKE